MTYLLRVNLDINPKDIGKGLRFKNTAHSIRLLSKSSNKVIILAHRGRPTNRDSKLSLKPFVAPLQKRLKKPVIFINHFKFSEIKKIIKRSPQGSIFLLENLRFLPGESKANKKLARSLASLGDRFVNDDFPTSHHVNASNVELAKLLPSAMGSNLKTEIEKLNLVMKTPRKPLVVIIGGAKTADKLGVIQNLLSKSDYILLGGAPANTMLKARGVSIGKSLYDPKVLGKIKAIQNKEKVVTPVDWRVKGEMILDIGPRTITQYRAIIEKAGTIIWNGPLGKYEDKSFDMGTKALSRAILGQKRANILIGGGDTLAAVTLPSKLPKNVFISSGGGAMLTYLSGAKLPALQAIKK